MIRTQFFGRSASGLTNKGRGRLLSSTALTAVVLVVGVGMADPAFAADKYFDGGDTVSDGSVDGGAGTWDVNTTTNWTDVTGTTNSEWQNGDDAFFDTIGGTISIVDPVIVNDMTFIVDGYDITLGGGGSFSLSAGSEVNVGTGNTATISAVIGGVGATLDKTGTGTLVLSGANTYTGATTVSAGTIIVSNNAGLGTTAGNTTVDAGATLILDGGVTSAENLVLDGGTLGVQAAELATASGTVSVTADSILNAGAGGTLTVSGVISGTAGNDLDKTGAGTVILSGANDYDGKTTVSVGTLVVSHNTALGSTTGATEVESGATLIIDGGVTSAENLILDGGTLGVQAAELATASGTVSVTADSILNAGAGGTLTVSGVISGTAGNDLDKTGAGTVILSGANDYDGKTTLSVGTLVVSHNTALGSTTGATEVESGATLIIDGGVTSAENLILDGGTLGVQAAELATASGTVSVTADSILNAGAGGTLTLSGVISGIAGDDLQKTGDGTVILSGTNTFLGGMTVSDGTLELNGGAALENTVAVDLDTAGATLDVNADEEIGSLAGVAGTFVTLDTYRLTTGGNDTSTTFAGVISGSGGITKNGTGTFTLSGVNTYSGATLVTAGTLDNEGTIAGAVTVSGGATLENNGIIGGLTTNNVTGLVQAGGGSSFGAVNNLGTFELNGTPTSVGAFSNSGSLDMNNSNLTVASLDNSGGGSVLLNNGVTGQSLTSQGAYSGGGYIYMDVDVGNAANADLFQYLTSDVSNTTINFNALNSNAQLLIGDIQVVDGGDGTATFTAADLPSSGGLIVYGFEQQGNDWYVTTDLNPDAPGSIASNVAIVQSTIGAVVNRPSSAFVTGLAAADAGHCGAGPWIRGTGGNATATGTTTGGGLTSTSDVELDYAGVQFGLDIACFNTDGEGFDIAYGAIGGYNEGSTTQQLSNDSTTASDFTQGYGGVYVNAHKGPVSFDLQARVDYSDFTFDNSSILLDDAKLGTTRYSLGGSASYAMSVSGLDVVPNAGFSASLTKSGSVAFGEEGQTLTPDDSVSLVGFAGGSVAKLFVVSNNTAAIVPFVSGNIYNDFAGPSTSTFTNPNADYSVDFESTNLGMFGELSVGVNYAKIFGDQDLRQMSATVRVDAKYSDTMTGLGVTAQVRGQF